MSATTTRSAQAPGIREGLPNSFKKEGVVYAMTFDMDIEQLRLHYGDPHNNAYAEIRRVLESHQFTWRQGSLYFGSPQVTAVSCVVAVQDLVQRFAWFAPCVRDIRMLRIEEFDDLMPAVRRVANW